MEQNAQSNSKRWIIILVTLVVLLLAGVAVYALQNSKNEPVNTSTRQTNTDNSTEISNPVGETPQMDRDALTITYTDNGFEPKDITVKKGSTVTVKNSTSGFMQFSSDDHPVHQDNEEMNLKNIGAGESVTYTASKTGTWGFHDHIEDSKTGTITVTE